MNILLIMCDQLCCSVLESYGGGADTPNIRKIAENGMVFDSAYCQTPVCSPSRASIITGRYPHNHGIVGNVMRIDYPAVGGPETEEGINNDDVTTESVLYKNGYNVMHAGKWHISGEELGFYKSMYREHQEYGREMKEKFDFYKSRHKRDGFMDWYGWTLPVTVSPRFKNHMEKIYSRENNSRYSAIDEFFRKLGRLDMPVEDVYDYRIASKCVEAIQNTDFPFMLTCSFNMPHDPNLAPPPYYESVRADRIEADAGLPCHDRYINDLSKQIPMLAGNIFLNEFLKIYYATVKFVDDQIGRVLDALKKKGVFEDTCVIFTADHGDMAGGHGMFWKSTSAFYDEITSVPLIISAPGLKKGRYSKPVELVDIMPTILDMCGIGPAADIDGQSLAPVMKGGGLLKTTAISERLDFGSEKKRFSHVCDENENFMLRGERYKYVIHRNKNEDCQMLFDLDNDPREYVDLYGLPEYREIADEMRETLRILLAESNYKFI